MVPPLFNTMIFQIYTLLLYDFCEATCHVSHCLVMSISTYENLNWGKLRFIRNLASYHHIHNSCPLLELECWIGTNEFRFNSKNTSIFFFKAR